MDRKSAPEDSLAEDSQKIREPDCHEIQAPSPVFVFNNAQNREIDFEKPREVEAEAVARGKQDAPPMFELSTDGTAIIYRDGNDAHVYQKTPSLTPVTPVEPAIIAQAHEISYKNVGEKVALKKDEGQVLEVYQDKKEISSKNGNDVEHIIERQPNTVQRTSAMEINRIHQHQLLQVNQLE